MRAEEKSEREYLKDRTKVAMDRLADLPSNESAQLSSQESETMQKYFGGAPEDKPKDKKASWTDTMKLALYTSFLFILLANPWVDSLMCVIPYCSENPIISLAVKTMLFMILFVVLNRYVV